MDSAEIIGKIEKYKIPLLIGGGIIVLLLFAKSKSGQSTQSQVGNPLSFSNGIPQTNSSNPIDTADLQAENIREIGQRADLALFKDKFDFLYQPNTALANNALIGSGARNPIAMPVPVAVKNQSGDTVGGAGILVKAVAGDSPYLSQALSGITASNVVNIAQNRYGTSITLPTDTGIGSGLVEKLLSGNSGPLYNNADLLFRDTAKYDAIGLIQQSQANTASLQSQAIATAGGLQGNATNFEIMGTEKSIRDNNKRQNPGGILGFLNGVNDVLSGPLGFFAGIPPNPSTYIKPKPTQNGVIVS